METITFIIALAAFVMAAYSVIVIRKAAAYDDAEDEAFHELMDKVGRSLKRLNENIDKMEKGNDAQVG